MFHGTLLFREGETRVPLGNFVFYDLIVIDLNCIYPDHWLTTFYQNMFSLDWGFVKKCADQKGYVAKNIGNHCYESI